MERLGHHVPDERCSSVRSAYPRTFYAHGRSISGSRTQGRGGGQRRHPGAGRALTGRDSNDPLLLQMKEATKSVLEPYTEPLVYESQGRRVVEGQRFHAGGERQPARAGTLEGPGTMVWNTISTVRQLWDGRAPIRRRSALPSRAARLWPAALRLDLGTRSRTLGVIGLRWLLTWAPNDTLSRHNEFASR